jgi:hypothetical protein
MTQTLAGKILKAFYAACMAFLGGLATVLQGPEGIGAVTTGQWVTIVAFTMGAAGGTFGLSGWAGPTVPGTAPKP